MSVSLQAVTFGFSFCHRQFRGAVNSRALRREHRLTTSLGRRWPSTCTSPITTPTPSRSSGQPVRRTSWPRSRGQRQRLRLSQAPVSRDRPGCTSSVMQFVSVTGACRTAISENPGRPLRPCSNSPYRPVTDIHWSRFNCPLRSVAPSTVGPAPLLATTEPEEVLAEPPTSSSLFRRPAWCGRKASVFPGGTSSLSGRCC